MWGPVSSVGLKQTCCVGCMMLQTACRPAKNPVRMELGAGHCSFTVEREWQPSLPSNDH